MRLIDADAFDKCLENAEAEAIHIRKYVFASAVNVIRGNLRSFPTIEPERKTGRWLWDRGARTCSVCGQMRYIGKMTAKDNFCPNCGARMEGDR